VSVTVSIPTALIARVVGWTVRAIVGTIALFLAATAALWKAPVVVLWLAALAVVALTPGTGRRTRWLWRGAAVLFAAWTIAFGILWRVPFREIEERMAELHRTAYANPRALSTVDRLAIYQGNLAMGLAGLTIGFPEVAWETARMAWPGPAEHVVASDFAMKSAKVREAVAAFARSLPEKDVPPRSKSVTLAWKRGYADYLSAGAFRSEGRVALAVNCPFELAMKASRDGYAWRIDCRGSCDVTYGRFKEMTPMFRVGGETAYVSETMFAALRRLGWLHPFTVTYVWSVASDDERLR
jgi:hypothetical protein